VCTYIFDGAIFAQTEISVARFNWVEISSPPEGDEIVEGLKLQQHRRQAKYRSDALQPYFSHKRHPSIRQK
jgi:hypothetical protein